MTPHSIHYGTAQAIHATRQATLDQAFLAHPNRFKGKPPQPHRLPTEVWINPPKDSNNLNIKQPNTLN
jgi:putative transposase